MNASWLQYGKAALLAGVFVLCTINAAGQSFDRAVCRESTTTTGTFQGPDPFWEVFDGQSIELIACETTGVPNTVNCPSPGAPPGNVGLSLSPDGPFSSEVRVTTTWGNCGSGCLQSPPFYVKGLTDGPTKVDICPTVGQGFPVGCFGRGPGFYKVFTVQSMDLEPANSTLEDWNGGKRIFPGKQTPSDSVPRGQVKVKATTNAQPPDPSVFPEDQIRAKVFFESIDMDDPSTDDGPVDGNGDQGDDNRGMPNIGMFTMPQMVEVDDNTMAAETEFEVTMHPGDNFKVVAGCDQPYLNGVKGQGPNVVDADGATIETTERATGSDLLTVWRRLHLEVDEMGIVAGNQVTGTIQEVKSVTGNQAILVLADLSQEEEDAVHDADRFEDGLVTIDGLSYAVLENGSNKGDKETVTIQVPVLPLPVVTGRPFVLVDDDDHNLSNGANLMGDEGEKVIPHGQVFSFMEDNDDPSANVFAPAFIMPTYDGAGGSNETMATFDLNTETTGEIIGPADPPTPQFRQSVGSDDYWVGYFLIGYQGKLVADADPLSEGGLLLGLTGSAKGDKSRDTLKFGVPTGGFGSIVFMEPAKEGPSIGFPEDVFNSTAAHEMGHQFGLGGDDNKREFGIMSQSPPSNPSTGRPSYEFVDEHLNILRSRIKTPGMK